MKYAVASLPMNKLRNDSISQYNSIYTTFSSLIFIILLLNRISSKYVLFNDLKRKNVIIFVEVQCHLFGSLRSIQLLKWANIKSVIMTHYGQSTNRSFDLFASKFQLILGLALCRMCLDVYAARLRLSIYGENRWDVSCLHTHTLTQLTAQSE